MEAEKREDTGKDELNLRSIIFSIKKRKFVFIVSFLVFSAIPVFLQISLEKKNEKKKIYYEADADIVFKKFSYIPFIMRKFGFDIDEIKPDLDFERRVVRSYDVAEKTFELLKENGFFASEDAGRFRVEGEPTEQLKHEFISHLIRSMRVDKFSDDEMGLRVRVIWDTKGGAVRIVNAVVSAYREYLTEKFKGEVQKALLMMEEAISHLEYILSQSYREFAEFTSESGIIDIRFQVKMIFDTLQNLKKRLNQLDMKKKMLSELLSAFESNQSFNIYDFLPVSRGFEELHGKLTELQMKRIELLSRYTEKHPKVRALDKKIELIRRKIRRKIITELRKIEVERKMVISDIRKVQNEVHEISSLAIEYIRKKNKLELINSLFYEYYQGFLNATLLGGVKFSLISDVKKATFARRINPLSRKMGTILLMGLVVGFVAGLLSVFLVEGIDVRFRDISELEEELGIPLLGILPETRGEEERKLFSEVIKGIRINIELLAMERSMVIGIFSALSGEGKTRLSVELAKAFAGAGKKTCLVDFNIRHPVVHRMLGIENREGVTDAVVYDLEIEKIIRDVDGFFVISAGMKHPSPPDLLSSPKLSEFISRLKEKFDIVIFDTSPVLGVPDALPVGRYADFGVLVVNMKKTAKFQVMRAKSILTQSRAKVRGVVANFVSQNVSPYIKYYLEKYDY